MNDNNEKGCPKIDLEVLLYDFFKASKRLWWVAVLLVAVFSGLLCFRAKRAYTPQYRAYSTFTVSVLDPLQAGVTGYNSATADQMAKTFPYILTSGALKDLVMRDLDIPVLPAIKASVMSNTNVFTLEVVARDPQLASDVLASVIEHYPDVAEFVVGPTKLGLLDESGVPQMPNNPFSYMPSIKKGIILGLGVWILLSFLMSRLRSTVHNEDELKQLLNVRCLGSLPEVRLFRRVNRKRCPILDSQENDRSFAGAMRLLRVRVEKEMHAQGQKVLLISSAIPGEGKTTVSINLAKSLAMKDKKVLLIDCDLRNPSVAKNLGISNRDGLVDMLEGRTARNVIVQKRLPENCHVIVAGGPAENAAELLAKKNIHVFLEKCRNLYDYIILDTPPAAMLSDAAELASAADAALLVIRQDHASKMQIVEGAQTLSECGLPLLGCALNYRKGWTLSEYGGYYGYGKYGYGKYGHGYGYEADNRHIKE